MEKLPRALQLADWLDEVNGVPHPIHTKSAAAELRRLHEANEQLLDDLATIVATTKPSDFAHVRAAHAIFKAQQQVREAERERAAMICHQYRDWSDNPAEAIAEAILRGE